MCPVRCVVCEEEEEEEGDSDREVGDTQEGGLVEEPGAEDTPHHQVPPV